MKINTDKEGLVNSGGENASSEKIFDEDSTNITNLNEVQYVVKFSGNPSKTAFIMSNFLDLKYEKLQELPRVLILQTWKEE